MAARKTKKTVEVQSEAVKAVTADDGENNGSVASKEQTDNVKKTKGSRTTRSKAAASKKVEAESGKKEEKTAEKTENKIQASTAENAENKAQATEAENTENKTQAEVKTEEKKQSGITCVLPDYLL